MSMFRRSPSQYSMYFQRKNMQLQGPACLGKSMNGLLRRSNQGNLLLEIFQNAALIMGILLQTGRWRISGEVLPKRQSIESRISIRLCMRLMQYTKQCFPEHAGMNICMKKKDTKTQLQITYRTVAMNNEKQLQKMNNRTSFSEKKLTLIAKYMTEQLQMIVAPNCKVQDRAIASEQQPLIAKYKTQQLQVNSSPNCKKKLLPV